MYKLAPKNINGQQDTVFNLDKNLAIPFDPDNTDYQAYLKWVAEGNTPDPAENE
jgi:hypothetical protein